MQKELSQQKCCVDPLKPHRTEATVNWVGRMPAVPTHKQDETPAKSPIIPEKL